MNLTPNIIKRCTQCGRFMHTEKDFGLRGDKKNKTLRKSYCKKCGSVNAWISKQLDPKHIDKRRAYDKEYYQKNKARKKSRMDLYRKENPDKVKETWRKWYSKKGKEWNSKWRKEHPEYLAKAAKRFRDKNPDKIRAYNSKIRAKRKGGKVELTYLEEKQIHLLYSISKYLGEEWQVDHIIPLTKGGVHHPDNLQILEATENLRKSNKLDYIVKGYLIKWSIYQI